MIRILFILIVFCSFAVAGFAADTRLDGLTVSKNFKSMRSSSVDPNYEGNGDARPIAPGGKLVIADLKGPGKITHIWFTISSFEKYYGKKLVIRMYWDGETNPSVEVPLNDFFLEGHGMDVVVDSAPIRVTSDGKGRNSYFVMPFKKSAKIEIENQGSQPINAFYYYIDWQKEKSLPKNTIYFHASYRQEFPTTVNKDYNVADIEGKGVYVGTLLSVRSLYDSWYGEGDDRFYIDGEKTPSIQGTGTEDYFCDGWGFRKFHGQYYGVPIYEGLSTGDKTTVYRFHIPDPIVFNKSLIMDLEHKGAMKKADGGIDGYSADRIDDYSSVAYWYQTEPHKKFAPLPAVEDRLYKPVPGTFVLEVENLKIDLPGYNYITQEIAGLMNGKQALVQLTEEKAAAKISFNIDKPGNYNVVLYTMKSWDYGKYDIYMDDVLIKRAVDFYSDSMLTDIQIKLGEMNMSVGEHKLKLVVSGKNGDSAGYILGVDAIEFIPVIK